jgi:phage-related protein
MESEHAQPEKPLHWVGSSKEDLKDFPEDMRIAMGYNLRIVQNGGWPSNAKVLKGFGGSGLLEILDDYDSDTYRVVYTIRFEKAVYVLHAFQKKSKQGIKTPQKDLNLIDKRLKEAAADYAVRYKDGEKRSRR